MDVSSVSSTYIPPPPPPEPVVYQESVPAQAASVDPYVGNNVDIIA